MGAVGARVKFGAVREAAFGAIGASYTQVGDPFSANARMLYLGNGTDKDIYVSFDGTTNNIRLSPNSFQLFDFTSNAVSEEGFWIAINTILYVKRVSAAPTSGTFWVEEVYQASV